MFSRKTQKKTILITGASTGIGMALLKNLSATEHTLIATARAGSMRRFHAEGLGENERIVLRPLEVTNAAQAEKLIREIEKKWGGVDVLVNNAGINMRSVIEHTTPAEENLQFAVNFFAPMYLIRLCLPLMRKKRSGHIINISSVGGTMAMPTMGYYSASKFALEGASEALWYELRPWNVRVTLIEPGFVRSRAHRKVILAKKALQSNKNIADDYHLYYRRMGKFIGQVMERSPTTADKVAHRISRVIHGRSWRLRVPATMDAWFFYIMRRALPRTIYHNLLYHGLPGVRDWVRPSRERDQKMKRDQKIR